MFNDAIILFNKQKIHWEKQTTEKNQSLLLFNEIVNVYFSQCIRRHEH